MEILEKIKKAERYEAELSAKIELLTTQMQRILAECGYSSEQEALEAYEELTKKLPEYEQKLDLYLTKIKDNLEEIDAL